MRNLLFTAALSLFIAASASAAIKEEAVTYKDGDTVLKGFVVYDDAKKGKRPGIVVVHEWWGITKHTRAEARRFAQEGYTAFIADMYGEARAADNPTDDLTGPGGAPPPSEIDPRPLLGIAEEKPERE